MVMFRGLSLAPMLQPSGSCVAACVPLSTKARISSGSGVESLSAATVRVTGEVVPPGIVSVPLPVPSESSLKVAPLSAVVVISLLVIPSPETSMCKVACEARSWSKLTAKVVLAPSLMLPSAGADKVKTLPLEGIVKANSSLSASMLHPDGSGLSESAASVSVRVSSSSGTSSGTVCTLKTSSSAEPSAGEPICPGIIVSAPVTRS